MSAQHKSIADDVAPAILKAAERKELWRLMQKYPEELGHLMQLLQREPPPPWVSIAGSWLDIADANPQGSGGNL